MHARFKHNLSGMRKTVRGGLISIFCAPSACSAPRRLVYLSLIHHRDPENAKIAQSKQLQHYRNCLSFLRRRGGEAIISIPSNNQISKSTFTMDAAKLEHF